MAKILLVDDDVTIVSLLDRFLGLEGFEVAKLKQFDDVIETIHAERPWLVLMDVRLPDVDGIQILERIRQDPQLCHTNVIMSSGSDVEHECLAKGADGFLLKPYLFDELMSKIGLLSDS